MKFLSIASFLFFCLERKREKTKKTKNNNVKNRIRIGIGIFFSLFLSNQQKGKDNFKKKTKKENLGEGCFFTKDFQKISSTYTKEKMKFFSIASFLFFWFERKREKNKRKKKTKKKKTKEIHLFYFILIQPISSQQYIHCVNGRRIKIFHGNSGISIFRMIHLSDSRSKGLLLLLLLLLLLV